MSAVHALSLSHYSKQPLGEIRDAPDIANGKGCYKPAGLWVSVDGEDDWPSWCQAESFGLERLGRKHRIVLMPNAKILLLKSANEIFDFSDEYFDPTLPSIIAGIDWARVAKLYDGIVIAPYQWDCRFADRTNWYYGWDCASGVIWKARAISHAEEVASGLELASTERPEGTSNSPLPDAPKQEKK